MKYGNARPVDDLTTVDIVSTVDTVDDLTDENEIVYYEGQDVMVFLMLAE